MCPSGTIKCFVYATFGAAGGRCDGDPFRDDPSNMWTYLPEEVANKIIGQSNFTFEVVGESINGVSASPKVKNTHESNRLKVLALCESTSDSNLKSSTNGTYLHNSIIGLFALIVLLL
jgi:hypothetical protein